ncbi:hypothetical protein BCD91_004332 [Clostridium beijerinckii]|nr:hypothetical protein [Clostridium beijerinckii]
MAIGYLKVKVFKDGTYIPIENAKITITQNSQRNYRKTIKNLSTDLTGMTNVVELETPPLEYSMQPSDKLPYGLCDIIVEASGYRRLTIRYCEIYPGITSIQDCYLNAEKTHEANEDSIYVSEHTMIGDYEPKIPESEEPKVWASQLQEESITPDKQMIPYTITIHDGHPYNKRARVYTVNYKDYIKNVAASEIYGTWPIEAIKANVIAIISFTLNRLFTEWYFGKSNEYQITSSTAFDHKWTRGIAIPESIDKIVDEIFAVCIKKSNYEFPILTQYTDGKRVPHRQKWLSQWGSKELADQGRKAEEILKYYYGPDIEIVKIEKMGDLQKSYPGYSLQLGSKEESVKLVQEYLNTISRHYPSITKLNVDGIFDDNTKKAVQTFQGIFNLSKSGVVDYSTWYKISDIYVGVTNTNFDNSTPQIIRTFIPPLFDRYSSSNFPTFTYPHI